MTWWNITNNFASGTHTCVSFLPIYIINASAFYQRLNPNESYTSSTEIKEWKLDNRSRIYDHYILVSSSLPSLVHTIDGTLDYWNVHSYWLLVHKQNKIFCDEKSTDFKYSKLCFTFTLLRKFSNAANNASSNQIFQ